MWQGQDPAGSPEVMCEAVRVKSKLQWRTQEVRDARNICQGKLHATNGARPRERTYGLKKSRL
jgi:hypothetical protein